jgi:hypothetical protein
LSFCEGINQTIPPGPIPTMVEEQRQRAAELEGIPFHPSVPLVQQYRRPYPVSKQNLQSYARYIARTVKHPRDPDRKPVSVKIYRVQHNILSAMEINAGVKPDSRTTYYAFFQGEFTPQGDLINPNDPFLYWLIPILPAARSDGGGPAAGRSRPAEEEDQVTDYVERHARLVGSNRRNLLEQGLFPPIPGEDDTRPRR